MIESINPVLASKFWALVGLGPVVLAIGAFALTMFVLTSNARKPTASIFLIAGAVALVVGIVVGGVLIPMKEARFPSDGVLHKLIEQER